MLVGAAVTVIPTIGKGSDRPPHMPGLRHDIDGRDAVIAQEDALRWAFSQVSSDSALDPLHRHLEVVRQAVRHQGGDAVVRWDAAARR